MQQGSTLLKVVSIIMIVFGALATLVGLVSMLGGGFVLGAGAGSADEAAAVAGGVIAIVGLLALLLGAGEIIVGIVGLKASKENGKHTAAFVLGIIGVVFAAISLVAAIAGSNGDMSTIGGGLVGLVLPILFLVGVNQTRQGI